MKIKNFIMLGGLAAILANCGGSTKITEVNPYDSPRVFFAYDSAEVTDEARHNLLGQALYLKNNQDVNILIEGNCDERGTVEYNLALGQRRANASKSVIVKDGVDSSRVSTISYGKERPWALGSDAEAWAKNRNTTTVVK